MRLHPPERAQSEPAKRALQLADVMPPYGELVQQIEGALAQLRRGVLERLDELTLDGQRRATQLFDAAPGSVQQDRKRDLAGGETGAASLPLLSYLAGPPCHWRMRRRTA